MPNDQMDAMTLCPFYKRHSPLSISCEGPANASSLTLTFPSQSQRLTYQKNVCCRLSYRSCPMSIAAARKYDESGARRPTFWMPKGIFGADAPAARLH